MLKSERLVMWSHMILLLSKSLVTWFWTNQFLMCKTFLMRCKTFFNNIDWAFKNTLPIYQKYDTRVLTHWCPAAETDLQHRIQNLKDRGLLMIGQQQNSKVHLWSGVLSIRNWHKKGSRNKSHMHKNTDDLQASSVFHTSAQMKECNLDTGRMNQTKS